MRAIRLPNGNLLVPVEPDTADGDEGWAEISADDEGYDRWLPFAEDGADPRPPKKG